MKRLALAFQFLTALPFRVDGPPQPGDTGRAAAWFPLVGLVIGALVWEGRLLLDAVFPPLVSASLCVLLWTALTGGLHLDGLADCCDGLLSAAPPERRLEIMKDPRLGTFGGAGLILLLLLKTATLASMDGYQAGWALLLAPVMGRWLLLWAGRQRPARPGGMAADFAFGLQPGAFVGAAILPLMLTLAGGWRAVLAAGLAHLAAVGIFHLAHKRLGGLTGDVYGLTVEVAELVTLLAFVVRI